MTIRNAWNAALGERRSSGTSGVGIRRRRPVPIAADACSWTGIGMAPLTATSNNPVRVSANRPDSERLMARHVRRNGRIHARPRSRSAAHERGFAPRESRAFLPIQRLASALTMSCRLSYLDESARQRSLTRWPTSPVAPGARVSRAVDQLHQTLPRWKNLFARRTPLIDRLVHSGEEKNDECIR